MKESGWGRYPRTKRKASGKSVDEIAKELQKSPFPYSDYRERSLKIHGLICAKCGREFDHQNRHLLTVHHKDGNSKNNPPDGSNWENLCVYCHDDEHSRELLGKYLRGEEGKD
jgi:5-methylcytosine-specific restriction endonuclease McrA